MAIGSIIGTIGGAALGSVLVPGAGTVAGAQLGASLGAATGAGIEGLAQQGKANRLAPPAVDPLQIQLYQQLEQQKKQLEAGTAYQAQQDVLKQAGLRGMEAVSKITGGDVGATINAMKTMARATGRNLNELYSSMNLEGLKLTSQMESLAEKIANRKLGLQMAEKVQAQARATAASKAGAQNLLGTAASELPLGGGEGNSIWDLIKNALAKKKVTETVTTGAPDTNLIFDAPIGGEGDISTTQFKPSKFGGIG